MAVLGGSPDDQVGTLPVVLAGTRFKLVPGKGLPQPGKWPKPAKYRLQIFNLLQGDIDAHDRGRPPVERLVRQPVHRSKGLRGCLVPYGSRAQHAAEQQRGAKDDLRAPERLRRAI